MIKELLLLAVDKPDLEIEIIALDDDAICRYEISGLGLKSMTSNKVQVFIKRIYGPKK